MKEKKKEIVNRIEEFRHYRNMSVNSLAAAIGIGQSTIQPQIKGDKGLSSDFIIALLNKYGDLSAEWLLRDRGDMLISKFSNNPEGITLKYSEQISSLLDTQKTLQDIINIKSSTIDILQHEIAGLKQELNATKSNAL